MKVRIIKVTIMVCIIVICLSSGLYWGSQIERKDHAAVEAKSEYVQTIAVVNMDEGIMQNNSSIYYSRDFLIYPNVNFTVTGLEDARQGIYQGRYGAYLIVPAGFSRSIASINGIPQKSTLEYEVNPKLAEGIRSEVISDIQQFQLVLNTNISYVYVSSILDEFHHTQDSAVIVLKNDQNELEKISGIEADKLLQELAYSEIEYADYYLNDLDVDQAFSDSADELERLGDSIMSDLQEGEGEFENIREQNSTFRDGGRDLFNLLDSIVPGQTLSGALVYEDGLQELERTIDTFHNDIGLKRESISNRLYTITDEYRLDGEEYLSNRVPQLQGEVNLQLIDQVNLLQNGVDQSVAQIQLENHAIIQDQLILMEQERMVDYEWIQNYIDQQLGQIFIDLKEVYEADANQQLLVILDELGYEATPSEATPSEATPSEATPSEATPSEAYRISLATPSQAEIDLDQSGVTPGEIAGRHFPLKNAVSAFLHNRDPQTDIWIALQAGSIIFPDNFIVLPLLNRELYRTLAVEIEGLYYISIDAVKEVLQEQVIDAIEDENEVQKTEIEVMMDQLRDQMEDYEKSIDNFDPYIYIHLNEISQVLDKVNRNIGLIDQSIYEKTDQDRAYVDLIFDLVDKNIDALQDDMEKTNVLTLSNILSTIDTIQTSRIEVNQENTDLLEAFTRKLSYTRLGSIGNKEAYDFIVNPVSMVSKTSEKLPFFQLDSELKRYLFVGVMVLTIAGGGGAGMMFLHLIQRRKQSMISEQGDLTHFR